MAFHDPLKQLKYLRQTLSQDKKPIGFFISAGCPLAVKMPSGSWPLIPDVMGLTKFVTEELQKDLDLKDKYNLLLDELLKTGRSNPNVEDILSFVRGMKQISKGAENVRGFSENELKLLEDRICAKISEKLKVALPDNKTPYHHLAKWIQYIQRDVAIEVFTTNYDLLVEQAFEEISVPYFDGFVGARNPFFDLRAVEDSLIPVHWTRLWKIHGSINWHQKSNNEVFRSTSSNGDDPCLIYPSHLKYDQSRKMPYLALIDRLNNFLRQTSPILLISGYSFSDDHLNDTIINALKANPTAMVIALLFGPLTRKINDGGKDTIEVIYPKALELAENRSNLSIWAFDEAVIGGLRTNWKPSSIDYDQEDNYANSIRRIEEKVKSENDEENVVVKYELHLGDFAVFGNLLHELIGKEQFKLNDNK